MDNSHVASPAVVYSSFIRPSRSHFHGWCFVGANYIFGDAGRHQFETVTGTQIGPGHDGWYVSIRATADGYEIGVDSAGMAKIFYYQSGGIWAFGNSLAALANHLQARGVALAPNLSALEAQATMRTFTTQVHSFSTIFRDIKLLPSFATLRLGAAGLQVQMNDPPEMMPYVEALETFLEAWRDRTLTLLEDDRVVLSSDLTGGIDSRMVFAMLASAKAAAPDARGPFILSSEAAHWAADYRSARAITSAYGMKLNDRLPREAAGPMSGQQTYERWREVSLGVYLPVYLHRTRPDPFLVRMGGGGGENFRHFYAEGSREKLLGSFRSRMSPSSFEEWRSDVDSALNLLTERTPTVPADIAHYREFRNRFHTGRSPHYMVSISPLASTLLQRFDFDPAAIVERQIYFDVMESLAPGLKDLPYDDERKAPSSAVLRRLTKITLAATRRTGSVYAAEAPTGASSEEKDSTGSAEEIFLDEASRVLSLDSVRSLMPGGLRSAAETALDEARRNGKFAHARDGKPISHAMAIALALGERTESALLRRGRETDEDASDGPRS